MPRRPLCTAQFPPAVLITVSIVFPKHTDLICIFNQCSDRLRSLSRFLSTLPRVESATPPLSVRLATRSFPPGTNSPCAGSFSWRNSIFAISPDDCHRNRGGRPPRPFLPCRRLPLTDLARSYRTRLPPACLARGSSGLSL